MHKYNPKAKIMHFNRKEYAPDYIKKLCRSMRKSMTNAELALWEKISGRQLDGLKFRKQHPIGRYIVDFYCFEKKLIIEVDGDIHEKQKGYDRNRECELIAKGNKIIRYKNYEVLNSIDTVLTKISEFAKNLT